MVAATGWYERTTRDSAMTAVPTLRPDGRGEPGQPPAAADRSPPGGKADQEQCHGHEANVQAELGAQAPAHG